MKEKLLAGAAVITALGVVIGALEYFGARPVLSGELRELVIQVAANTRASQLQRWQYLHAKKVNQGLDTYEQAEYCELSRLLGFQGVGCA